MNASIIKAKFFFMNDNIIKTQMFDKMKSVLKGHKRSDKVISIFKY